MLKNNHEFSDFDIEQLKKYRDQCKDIRVKERILSIIMYATLSISTLLLAEIFGKTERTIENWILIYINDGIKGISSFNYKPKKKYLSFHELQQLRIFVTFDNPETIKEIIQYIKNKFDVEYSIEGARKILAEMGLKRLRSKVIPGTPPSVEEQEQFIKEYEELKTVPNSITLFGDGMHLIHQNLPGFCWGDPHFKPILETNSGRKRLNILGAYDPQSKSLVHLTGEDNCNAERVIEFLSIILKTYKDFSLITIILDNNARYFHASMVQEWLEKNNKIKIKYLPPYSPNLNLIERFWKFSKKTLVRNKYYKTYKEFRANVFQFLNNVKDHCKDFESLMVEKFQIVRA